LLLWQTNVLLALLASLGIYALGVFVLKAFTPNEIAAILGRPLRQDVATETGVVH
jgi:hypothetical protein